MLQPSDTVGSMARSGLLCLAGCALLLPPLAAEDQSAFQRLDRPAVGLFTIVSRPVDMTDADVRRLAESFQLLHGKLTPDQFDAVRRIAPGFRCLRYVNSTYTRFASDAREVESRYRTSLCMHLACRTEEPLCPDTVRFRVAPIEGRKSGPAGRIAIRASTVEGDLSSLASGRPSTRYFVFWIRLGDELMRVNSFDRERREVEVTRGFEGTSPVAHPAGAPVFSPVYLGFRREHKDKYPGYHPGGPGDRLRYVLDPHSPPGYQFLSDVVVAAMTDAGADGVWLDTLNVGDFNLSDCLGRKVTPWDFQRKQPYAPDDFRQGQERKIDFVQRDVHTRLGCYPVLVANNLKPTTYGPGKGGIRRLLESTQVKPRPLDGFCMENGLSWHPGGDEQDRTGWYERIAMLMDAAQSGLAAMPILGAAGGKSVAYEADTPERERAERFGYASYLLAVEKGGHTLMGTYAFYRSDGRRFVKVHPMYYYPIGDPAETMKPKDFDAYRMNEAEVYQRRFTNGLVLVNPSISEQQVELETAYLDPDTAQVIERLTMPPGTGKILLLARTAR